MEHDKYYDDVTDMPEWRLRLVDQLAGVPMQDVVLYGCPMPWLDAVDLVLNKTLSGADIMAHCRSREVAALHK